MKIILQLNITKIDSIVICVPDFNEKINWYYPVTEQLHRFDEVKIIFESESNCFILSEDIISYAINRFKDFLYKLLENAKEKPDEIDIGYMGYYWNKDIHSLMHNQTETSLPNVDIYSYVIWEGLNINTYAYNANQKIYIEISPIYQSEKDNNKSFELINKSYQPLVLLEVPRTIVLSWFDSCEAFIKNL